MFQYIDCKNILTSFLPIKMDKCFEYALEDFYILLANSVNNPRWMLLYVGLTKQNYLNGAGLSNYKNKDFKNNKYFMKFSWEVVQIEWRYFSLNNFHTY